MNIKEQLNFIALQEQVANLHIKMKAIESLLIEKNVFTVDEYKSKLNEIVESTAEIFKPVKEQFEKLQQLIEKTKAEMEAAKDAAKDAAKETIVETNKKEGAE